MTHQSNLDYHATSFSQGRMDFAWEELTDEERRSAYADWNAGKGLIGGDPHYRPGAETLPTWGLNLPFFRTLALDDPRGDNGTRLRAELASNRPLEIEIGYGRGDFLLDRAKRHPDTLFIGYETQTGATRRMLNRITPGGEYAALKNIWLSDDDCRFNIPRIVADGRVDAFHILFPDPWWKEQHKVKRLFAPPFVDLLAAKLRPGGLLHFKSDVLEYGELVRYLVEGQGVFSAHEAGLAARIGEFMPTHREQWCVQSGKPVSAYYFVSEV